MNSKKIIINADDFGYNSNINAAIVSCFQKKIINSTTIMVNMDMFEEAVILAKKHGFNDKIGVHFNLTEGKSLTDLSGTGLTDNNGVFIRKAISNPLIFLSSYKLNKIRIEIREQYKKLLANGINPTHFDSHHHVHTLFHISSLFIELAKEKKQKSRLANIRIRKNFIYLIYNMTLNNIYKSNQINFTDKFERVSSFIKNYSRSKDKNLLYEIMVHPGYEEDILCDIVEHTNLEESFNNLRDCLNLEYL